MNRYLNTLSIKDGVEITQLHMRLVMALPIILTTFAQHGSDVTITSGRDGEHKDGSLHYAIPLQALDFRIWYVDYPETLVKQLKIALGADFDVVLERTHIHIELDPKYAAHSGNSDTSGTTVAATA